MKYTVISVHSSGEFVSQGVWLFSWFFMDRIREEIIQFFVRSPRTSHVRNTSRDALEQIVSTVGHCNRGFRQRESSRVFSSGRISVRNDTSEWIRKGPQVLTRFSISFPRVTIREAGGRSVQISGVFEFCPPVILVHFGRISALRGCIIIAGCCNI